MKLSEIDKLYIARCYELAKKGLGKVSPNPLVGAVLVKNGVVIGEGYHKKYGDAHAEVNAIKNSKVDVAGSTLYCNLEPCCHTNKQTPPCVPVIIKKKIKRVVVSNLDPNKAVNGKGIRQLRAAGIKVNAGVLEKEGKKLNKFYFKYAEQKIPYITLKIAQSIDGKISLSKNKQTWLTGNKSIKVVHKLRSEYDTVLVGGGTVRTDNPLLTVREAKGRNPIRVIIDGKLSIPLNSRILITSDPQNTFIFIANSVSKERRRKFEKKGIKLFKIDGSIKGKINLKNVLRILADNKITSVMVEGGKDIFTQFIEQKLYDEIIIFQSPKILGRGINAFNPKTIKTLVLKHIERLGDDIKLTYRRN